VIELRRVPTALAPIVSRAVDSTQHLMQQHRHTVHMSQAPEPVDVLADPVRLEQVLVNLLINAAKYTPPQGSIWVSVHCSAEHAELRVRDTGVGIEPQMLARVFDLFQQAERGLDRAQGGLGIGLTVARRLVELHGGSIEAYSEGAGRGAEFVARLPRLAPGQRAASAAPAARGSAHEPLRALRILVVDDNRDAAEMLCVLLREAFGHQTRMASDGPSALQIAAEFAPELVLLDIGLPRMDGYAVARELRAAGCCAPLVAVTGYGQERDRERTRASGFSAHLVKPVQLAALRRILETRSEVEPTVH
jgi:CheY-like chemotaxis protein